MFTTLRPLSRVTPLLLALVLALLVVSTASAAPSTHPLSTDFCIEDTPNDMFSLPAIVSYNWTDWGEWGGQDVERYIFVTISHNDNSQGHITLVGRPQNRYEPAAFRLAGLSRRYDCDIQERLLASWSLSFLNDDIQPDYFSGRGLRFDAYVEFLEEARDEPLNPRQTAAQQAVVDADPAPIDISHRSGDSAASTSSARTLLTPTFTYNWTDWDYTRWITINVFHEDGAIGSIVIAGDPGRGEPGDYRLYSLRPADPSDISERLLAFWTLSYVNYLHAPAYFDEDEMEDYADWLYDAIREPGGW